MGLMWPGEITIILPMVYDGVPMAGFMADVDTLAPEELECRAHPMNYVIRLTGDLALSSAEKDGRGACTWYGQPMGA
jgi:hypothetical protein